ncbi:MAG: enolase C-terminal domain-like protein, partial [Alphaproteobacteria bacterium]
MKITKTEITRLAVPMRRPIRTSFHDFSHAHTVLVQMRTDAGLTGMGWCFAFEERKADVLALLAEDLAALYTGRDPRAVRDNHAMAWKDMNFLGHAGASMIALSGIDTACWELAALAADVPLYRHLGGARTRVQTYASSALWLDRSIDALTAEALELVNDGHRAMKVRVGQADFMKDVERVREVRAAVGPDITLMVDANQAW